MNQVYYPMRKNTRVTTWNKLYKHIHSQAWVRSSAFMETSNDQMNRIIRLMKDQGLERIR